MTASPPDTPLDAIRRDIDTIDTEIVSLLARRFAATERVKHTKAQDGSIASSPFRPAREAAMMRRLVAGAPPGVHPDLLVRLWRVILSASTQSQAPITIHMDAIVGGELPTRILVSQHFCSMDVELHDSPAAALEALSGARGDLAVIAPASDWAAGFSARAGGAQVIGSLPVLAEGTAPHLLVFGHAEPQPSGEDETLFLLAPESPAPASALWSAGSGTTKIAGLPGFLAEGEPAFVAALVQSPGARVAGRYPRPIKVST